MKQKNRQFFCYKFNSDRLKKFNYDIVTNFNEARRNGEIIPLADSQILRTIRDIKNINYDWQAVEQLYKERGFLLKEEPSPFISRAIKEVQSQINHLLFYPEYISVVIDKPKDYEHIFEYGFKVNGMTYRRLSCSAGQARNSTVICCSEDIIAEVVKRLNNERNMEKPIAPSKFNAYFGLYSSATKLVTEPKFAVVRDFEETVKFPANFAIETAYTEDDVIEQKEVEMSIDRMDGMGIISPKLAEQWAKDLSLDYVPSQFVVRQSFLKGLVTVFDFHDFCEKKNDGNYIVESVYSDKDGNPTYIDLRECDMIVSESQFKLWDSYESVEQYTEACHRNKLYWGVTQYSPKEYEKVTNLNYQFIQALNLTQKDIEDLCSLFVEWVSNVSTENIDYALLFLTGRNNTEQRIIEYLKSWDIYWIKSLILNREAINDKFFQKKIIQYIKNIINKAYLGQIPVYGNFQFLVTDPYAYMEKVCGKKPMGLLGKGEYFSNYWNREGVTKVIGMRSPLTSPSEPCEWNLKLNEETTYWYKYCFNGIIINWFGNDVVKLAGADYDGDLAFTSSNQTLINGINHEELPVTYNVPKPKKIIPTEESLYNADLFGMGSIIGQITNKGSSAYAMLPIMEELYGKESKEYQLMTDRIKQTCVLQSKQIDKTKIGQIVKEIPKCWTQRIKIDDDSSAEMIEYAELISNTLLNKKPYFFRYLYPSTNREFKQYNELNNKQSLRLFSKPLTELLELPSLSKEEEEFVKNYYKWSPLIISNSNVNMLCRYLENFKFDLNNKINTPNTKIDYACYLNKQTSYTPEEEKKVLKGFKEYLKICSTLKTLHSDMGKNYKSKEIFQIYLDDYMIDVCSNEDKVVNILINDCYTRNNLKNLDIIWNFYGRVIFNNMRNNLILDKGGDIATDKLKVLYPFKSESGDIVYLGEHYELREVEEIE